jgi:transposase
VAFTSWLGLCPNNKISGGRDLGRAPRPVSNRLATALRMAAQSLHHTQCPLGYWFRRMRAKLGTPGAITAAAHKLARVLYAMVKHRQPFDAARLGDPAKQRQRREISLCKTAKALGFLLQPIQPEPVSKREASRKS